MNKTFVAELENHFIYLVNDNFISFYINVLKKKDSTNISVDIKNKKTNSISSIIKHYEKIDNYNITLVVPVISINENVDEYKKQSNLVSKLINYSHKFLLENDINVLNNINLIKTNIKSDFIEFFIKQFSNRVRHITLDDLVHEEVPYNKIEAANISFVVGRPELELTIKDDEMKEIIEETKKETEKNFKEKTSIKKSNAFASGYVSYYLLGFLTAILTLLFITWIIK